MKNEKGFTLIEMMIVMLIISVLLIITIPNITKNNSNINNKGCSAFKKMVEAQIQSFEMEKDRAPASIDELKTEGYLKTGKCPDGTDVAIQPDGTVNTIAP
ncbi:competence type IV pilus major pilin ComGC [Bacillus sp. EB600]|uniref:competence type IV pilus major pilin ComGC n=1 Tax=Bacillus sp. EB600 TaxID=2806345 RepID=UPI00210B376E|nr:competence type IV pilus major pilin ComGC [Bacillus sp. EB600]MCQ6278081.1 prepilin-type N-terminal cleavage/methylation domain-containing protein [Bacillus sp. EB600]